MEDARCDPSINFQKYCTSFVKQISELDEATKRRVYEKHVSHEDRFKIIFEFMKTTPMEVFSNGKDLNNAQDAKLLGNKHFIDKKYDLAIESYNFGILTCPQTTSDHKELLSILVSNRSATFFEQKLYQNVIEDCDYVVKIGHYPLKFHHKLWLRKAKSYDALDNEKCAKISYDLALSTLKNSDLHKKDLSKKVTEIEELLQKPKKRLVPKIPINASFSGGEKFPAAHKNITFDFHPELGRFAIANTNIETGTIIAEELPHCAVLTHESSLTNCQFCCMSTRKPISCPNCVEVIFCSLECQEKAKFHRNECHFMSRMKKLNVSVNCAMALRMITQQSCHYFAKNKKLLENFLKTNKRDVQFYKSDDYLTAISLCRNGNTNVEIVHYCIMATFLLRLLKVVKYFGDSPSDCLTEQELFIGRLILTNLQILQFNSHEISELCNTVLANDTSVSYKNSSIGAGLYPTLALFNHSCDPTIARYNIGNRLIYRTIKPVRAGEIIFENYGALWTSMELNQRQDYLRQRYCFNCRCLPCQNNWPLLDNLDLVKMTIVCQTKRCPMKFILSDDNDDPFQKCQLCKKVTNVMPILNKLSKLMDLTPQAEKLYLNGKLEEAIKAYAQILNILYESLNPPHPDMVNAQQRLKTLFLHLGNKNVGYSQQL